MIEKCFTIETRLEKRQLSIEYFMWNLSKSCRLFRIVWKLIQTTDLAEHKLNTYLQNQYKIDKRSANTLIKVAKGRLRALKELKQVEKNQLLLKIKTIRKQIEELSEDIKKIKSIVELNKASEKQLYTYRRKKNIIWHKKQKLNRMIQKLNQYKINYYSVCWGSKKLFKAQYNLKENGFKSHEGWLNAFRRKRDGQINYIGCVSEPKGNQNCQLEYHEDSDTFSLKIRKDKEIAVAKEERFIYIKGLQFKYQKAKLIETLKAKETPLTYRILRRNRKWYLQVIFRWRQEIEEMIHKTIYGTIGLDYNEGFISMSETDYYGNLIHLKHYPLKYHGCGNKASSEIQEVIARIVVVAQEKEKPIVIKELDFKKTKAGIKKTSGKKGKRYQKMIHAFDYARYMKRIENACFRKKVRLIKVEAFYTTQIGMKKYGSRMKLNRHQAASYVIARKGQGYIDKLR